MNPGARKGPLWTPAEDAIVRELAPTHEALDLLPKLPGRTVGAIFHRLQRLGIQKRRRWTRAEDTALELAWGEPLDKLSRELRRTKITIYARACALGLLGIPRGGEHLATAAVRCGFDSGQLRKILKWAGVKLNPVPARRRAKPTYFWVDPTEVNDAVRAWLETETPNVAAKRIGCSAEKIEGRLKASGLAVPKKPRGRRHWRIPSKTIDFAMAMTEKRGKRVVLRRAA